MLCGGAEATVTPLAVGGFTSLKALSTASDPERASIPFDKERSGFVMGEGAGILVLEEYEHARARGAVLYGEIAGYGVNCDAYHITAPAPGRRRGGGLYAVCSSGRGHCAGAGSVYQCPRHLHPSQRRLRDGGGQSRLWRPRRRLMISSTKSMTGHLLGASGAVEAVFTLLAVRDGLCPRHHPLPGAG